MCTIVVITSKYNLFSSWLLYAKQQWPWSYGSWIYNYLCNQYLSPLILWIWISIMARCTTLCDKVCKWLATGRWSSPVSSNNKTDRHDISEILLKMALNTIEQTKTHYFSWPSCTLNRESTTHILNRIIPFINTISYYNLVIMKVFRVQDTHLSF
jgi:hypothetical protein